MKKSNNDFFNQGIKVLKQIESNGFEAYFVGGCVRDYILSLPMKDIDITTSATPKELKQIFPNLIPIGIEHGTVLVRENYMSFEITTYREEDSSNAVNDKNTFKFASSLEVDLKYRDFTMNALAMDCNMNIIDLHHGLEDLHAQVIRAVDNPLKRMQEDPLRVMRGIRFISQFGFSIEKETIHAMKKSAHLLDSVAVERVLMECEKIFTHAHSKQAIEQLVDIQIEYHLPIFNEEPDLLLKVLPNILPLNSFAEVIAVMHMLSPRQSLSNWCNRWKCSNKVRRSAKMLVHACKRADEQSVLDRFFIYTLEDELEPFYRIYTVLRPNEDIHLASLYTIEQRLPIKNRNELALKGNDIIRLFPAKQPGKWIDDLLTTIEYKVIIEELPNDHMTLKEWITCNPPETN